MARYYPNVYSFLAIPREGSSLFSRITILPASIVSIVIIFFNPYFLEKYRSIIENINRQTYFINNEYFLLE